MLSLLLMAVAMAAQAEVAGPVLFVSNRGGNAQIYRMNSDGSQAVALTSGPAENIAPAWSPDGRHIAFTSYRDGDAEIYVMNADGRGQTRLTSQPMADDAPAWMPDGRLVFRSMRSRWPNFYVMNADGSDVRSLTADEADKSAPLPSPDGRWVAYVGFSGTASSEIFVVPTVGGVPINLTGALSKNRKAAPAWSPDSRRLIYAQTSDAGATLHAIVRDGTEPQALTASHPINAAPVWSPDGRRIAFVSSREGTRQDLARGDIFVMNADGTGQTNLTRHPGEDNYPAWSADGSSIYFVSLRDGNAQIHVVPFQGGESKRLTHSQWHDLMIRPFVPPGVAGAALHAMRPLDPNRTSP